MRIPWSYRLASYAVLLAVAFVFASVAASAANPNLDHWFLSATAFNAPGTSQPMPKPDFLGSSDWRSCGGGHFNVTEPGFYYVWTLLKYDATHHIAFARGLTDQCSLALFKAPPPSVKAANADLSEYGTVRGLRLGSPYSKVLALYGPPVKHGRRFVTSYSAWVPAIAVNHKPVELNERVTLVIVDGFVSSISVYIDEAPLV
ncbi:MAG TPA: hypothetical protein VFE16_04415 [Candidatus Cybelea sp.]|jgi:hypothetical protein|nr:hypothetical protein [Candidatus Cybelea sp.]